MDYTQALLERVLTALVRLLLNPFYYISILFVILQYRRQLALERKLFHVKLHAPGGEIVRTVLWGLAAGLIASVLLAVTGISLGTGTVLLLWAVTLVLMLVRVRYLCLAYAAGIIGLAHSIASYFPGFGQGDGFGWLAETLASVDLPSLLLLVAVLHLLEAMLVRRQGSRLGTPLFVESKRGKLVGGYHLQGFWPVPLFLLGPSSGQEAIQLPWTPLFSGHWNAAGWDFLVFPAIIGFTQLTLAYLPKDKVKKSSGLLLLYALGVGIAAGLTYAWPPFGIAASLLALGLHEALVLLGSREGEKHPFFVHGPSGLMILAVLPHSAAAEAGIEAGETVHKVNGVKVRSKEAFHEAMQLNPAQCKLEILNLEGQSKFINRAIYSDEHHQLGLILAPDDNAPFYVSEKPVHFASYLSKRWLGLTRNGRR